MNLSHRVLAARLLLLPLVYAWASADSARIPRATLAGPRVQLAYSIEMPRLRELEQRSDPDGVLSSAIGGFPDNKSADVGESFGS